MSRILVYSSLVLFVIFFKLAWSLILSPRLFIKRLVEFDLWLSDKVIGVHEFFDFKDLKNFQLVKLTEELIELERKHGVCCTEIFLDLRKGLIRRIKLEKKMSSLTLGLIFQLLFLNIYCLLFGLFLSYTVFNELSYNYLSIIISLSTCLFLIWTFDAYFQKKIKEGLLLETIVLKTIVYSSSRLSFSEVLLKSQLTGDIYFKNKRLKQIYALLVNQARRSKQIGSWRNDDLKIAALELQSYIEELFKTIEKRFDFLKILSLVFLFVPTMFWNLSQLMTRIFDQALL